MALVGITFTFEKFNAHALSSLFLDLAIGRFLFRNP